MTPDQLTNFRCRLASNRQPVERGQQYAHPRGWNDALDFVERTLRDVLGEPAPARGEDRT
ncbi:hypothetical protein JQ633_12480 [Bradyrhizobium tropiciagri]|uniref:hypothetical protein n=1 Tax=Bradyrhizobium tropiciagri TaxID=312253 RepID=UPI001BA4CFCA|nr:hypothetical protein [Bradyrhizobium tropiciagri]MBR0871179.1 hypothetical protein [Bradyrhizobium tropiciagri]